jgi:hypothetical protein
MAFGTQDDTDEVMNEIHKTPNHKPFASVSTPKGCTTGTNPGWTRQTCPIC